MFTLPTGRSSLTDTRDHHLRRTFVYICIHLYLCIVYLCICIFVYLYLCICIVICTRCPADQVWPSSLVCWIRMSSWSGQSGAWRLTAAAVMAVWGTLMPLELARVTGGCGPSKNLPFWKNWGGRFKTPEICICFPLQVVHPGLSPQLGHKGIQREIKNRLPYWACYFGIWCSKDFGMERLQCWGCHCQLLPLLINSQSSHWSLWEKPFRTFDLDQSGLVRSFPDRWPKPCWIANSYLAEVWGRAGDGRRVQDGLPCPAQGPTCNLGRQFRWTSGKISFNPQDKHQC